MTLQECYAMLNGDYTGVIERLKKEAMVIHFLKTFIEEDLCVKLGNAIAAGNAEAAFRAAHSLKGNCMSLGFTQLQKLAEDITERLRNGCLDKASDLLEPLAKEYERTVNIVRQLDD